MAGFARARNSELGITSSDLGKAFDDVVRESEIIAALRQGADEARTSSLPELRAGPAVQVGTGAALQLFRRVRQGGAISPELPDANMEMTFGRWTAPLATQGRGVPGAAGRFANSTFADGVLLYGRSPEDAEDALSRFIDEFRAVGRRQNAANTKATSPKRRRCAVRHLQDCARSWPLRPRKV